MQPADTVPCPSRVLPATDPSCTDMYLAQAQLQIELVHMRGTSIATLLAPGARRAGLPQTLVRPCHTSWTPGRPCRSCGYGPIQRRNQQPPIKRLAGLGQTGLEALASRIDIQAACESLARIRITFMFQVSSRACWYVRVS